VTGVLIRDCDLDGRAGVDVRIRAGTVVEIGAALRRDGEHVLPAGGGAVIPGLHDHHLHLLALAADLRSVRCGPDDARDRAGFAQLVQTAADRGPVRGTGYYETVAGPLDRDVLDAVVRDVPVRIQHRSGAAWFLNSAALAVYDLLDSTDEAVTRDPHGRATGRLVRGDHLLRRSDLTPPSLAHVGQLLAAVGVTGVTDATPRLDATTAATLRAEAADGTLPQRLLLLGAPLADLAGHGVPWKVFVDELSGLDPAALVEEIRAAHDAGRPVAMHCTSRAETVLAVDVLRTAGQRRGDRLEHAGVLPLELTDELARAEVTVVTQPNFISERGDDYLTDVEAEDHDLLYRCGSLIRAGVAVAAGTDAPYGRPDPWAAIAAATGRRTGTGAVVGADERVSARRALDLFLGGPLAPGGPPRQVVPGAVADLCLLRRPLREVLAHPSADTVAATVIGGRIVAPRAD
jgi:predicted amidohydrolase YtcJ